MAKQRRWAHPVGIENDYVAALRRLARAVSSGARSELSDVLPSIAARATMFRPDADADPLPDDAPGYLGELYAVLNRVVRSVSGQVQTAYRAAQRYGGQTDTFNKREFHAVARSALGVDVFKAEPWLASELQAWEAANLALIKSIPAEHVQKLQGRIVQALRQGQSTARINETIRELTDVTADRAELIARDQIGKLNGQLTMLRQTGIGVKSYRWRGALDQRERATHRAREGVEFRWDQPPDDGSPGQPVRCRCWAEAVFPELAGMDLDVIRPTGSAASREAAFQAYAAQPYRTGNSFKGPR